MQAQNLYLERLVMIHPDDVGSMPMSSLITLCQHFADERPWKVREAKRDLLCSLVTYLHSLALHICSSWWPQPSRRCLFMNELAPTWETRTHGKCRRFIFPSWDARMLHVRYQKSASNHGSKWGKIIIYFSALPVGLQAVPATACGDCAPRICQQC